LNEIQLESAFIEIRAVDSSYFEVLTKESKIVKNLLDNFENIDFMD
jgi:hypothetical protein